MRATASGTHSSTIAKHTGLGERDRVVDDHPRAASSVLPCTRYPPNAFTDCGVSPR